MKKFNTRSVNAEIRKLGGEEVLVQGSGYWYFSEGHSSEWPATSVYVYRLSHLSLEQWVSSYKSLREDFERSRAS